MTTHDEKLLKTVQEPSNLTDEQVTLAQQYARSKMLDGHTVGGFCSANGISTKTWYKFLDIPEFVSYMAEIQNLVIPASEKDAFQAMKNHVLKIPFKENPSLKEIELFYDTFGYLAEADKREQMEKLGLNQVESKTSRFVNIEERKASLLSRLKG
jgi:hypothetical protein